MLPHDKVKYNMDTAEALCSHLVTKYGHENEHTIRDEISKLKSLNRSISADDLKSIKNKIKISSTPGHSTLDSSSLLENRSNLNLRSASVASLPSSVAELRRSPIPKIIIGRKLPIDQWDILNRFNQCLNQQSIKKEEDDKQQRKQNYSTFLHHQLKENEEKQREELRQAKREALEMEIRWNEQNRRESEDQVRSAAFIKQMIVNANDCMAEIALKKEKERQARETEIREARERARFMQAQSAYDQTQKVLTLMKRNSLIRQQVESSQRRKRTEKERNLDADRAVMATAIKLGEEADRRKEKELNDRKERIQKIANTLGKDLSEGLKKQMKLEDDRVERELMLAHLKMELEVEVNEQSKLLKKQQIENFMNEDRAIKAKRKQQERANDILIAKESIKAAENAKEQEKRERLDKIHKRMLMEANLKKQMHERRQEQWSNRLTVNEKAMNQDQIRLMLESGLVESEDVIRDLLVDEKDIRRARKSSSIDRIYKMKAKPMFDFEMEGLPIVIQKELGEATADKIRSGELSKTDAARLIAQKQMIHRADLSSMFQIIE